MSKIGLPGGSRPSNYRAWIAGGALAVALLSACFALYDLWRPYDFVLVRFLPLFPALFVLLLAVLGLGIGYRKTGRISLVGLVVLVFMAGVLLAIAIDTARSRYVWAERKTYPNKTVAELLRLATEKEDQFAINALVQKRDPAAVPELRRILLDQSESRGALRVNAAWVLCHIGTPDARRALEEAEASSPPPYLRDAIRYMLERIEFYEALPPGQPLPSGAD